MNAQEPLLVVEPRNTRGSTENLPLLDAGSLDIALVAGEAAHPALARPANRLHIVAAMYSSPGMFVVRADSPVRAIADLRGKPVALGAKGSGLTIMGRNVLGALGIDPDRDIEAIYLERAGDGPAMVLDGRATALWGAGVGWPGFEAVTRAGGRLVAPDAAQIELVLGRNPSLKPLTLPAGAYPGQDAPLATVGAWSYVLARPELPEETGYLLARALHRAQPGLAQRLAQARETTAANTLAAAPDVRLIHPGVLRFLREAGVLR